MSNLLNNKKEAAITKSSPILFFVITLNKKNRNK